VTKALQKTLSGEMQKLEMAGLLRKEMVLPSAQTGGKELDLTSYDYLGLSGDSRLVDAANAALDEYGVGVYSSRCFSGTREIHHQLETAISQFLGTSAAIVFGSGYLANQGVFGALFDNRDCVLCDAWVHPSVADGIRISGARAIPYRNNDIDDLQDKLKRSRAARLRAIVTEGVFASSGEIARLGDICELAERYEALVVVDDALGIGAIGPNGRGSVAHRNVGQRVGVITGSFSMALSGAAGGFVAASTEIVDWLRQKASPYLFSGALPPVMAAIACSAVSALNQGEAPIAELQERVQLVKKVLTGAGFRVLGREHPNLVVQIGDAVTLQKIVSRMFARGVRTSGLCYPVVPEREARLRLQLSAKHDRAALEVAMKDLIADAQSLGVLERG